MLKTVSHLLHALSPRRRRMFWTLIRLYMIVGLLQALGVASVGPFVSVLVDPESVAGGSGWITQIYDAAGFEKTQHFIAALGVMSAGLIIIGQLSFLLSERIRLKWMHSTIAELQSDVMRNILLRPYAFFATRHSGSLSNVVMGETIIAGNQFLFPLTELFSRMTVIVFLFTLLLFVNASVALGAFFVMSIIVLSVFFMTSKRLKSIGEIIREKNEQRFTRALEIFHGHKEIKLRRSEPSAISRFEEIVSEYAKVAAHAEFLRVIPRPMIEATLFAGIILTVALLAATSSAALTTFMPTAAVFLLASYRILPAFQMALGSLQGMQIGAPVAQSVLDELAVPSEHQVPFAEISPTERSLVGDFHSFTLSDVEYVYQGSNISALKDVNLTVQRNSCIGIVGQSGAGKSTLLDVMLGLLAPSSGTLEVDGTVLEGATLNAWRANVGYVSQSIFIADDTMAVNVSLGDDTPDMDRVRRAVCLASLEPFVAALPEGLETFVGEGGARMSGGQRQRLAIARALYNEPKVLFLDEATSALDTATETAIMSELKALVSSRTLIIIAHRLSTLSICDRIIEMKDGRIIQNIQGAEFFGRRSESNDVTPKQTVSK